MSVDGKYRFSLDVFQLGELGIKVGKEFTDQELHELEDESVFGKLYGRALEYTMMRPHSIKEVRDYLWRKTRATKTRSRSTGELIEREGVSQAIADRVLERLVEKGYLNDENFARYWVENRSRTKGVSKRKLRAELQAKGVAASLIELTFLGSDRDESEDLRKIIAKKQVRYPDEQKFIAYLLRQGFPYDSVRAELSRDQSAQEENS